MHGIEGLILTILLHPLSYNIQGRPEGGLGGGGLTHPNKNTSQQSDLFYYSLEGPNFTYGKQILHIS
jgi:hypothetical protein